MDDASPLTALRAFDDSEPPSVGSARGGLGDRHVEFAGELLAQIGIGFVGDLAEQLHPLVRKPLTQRRPKHVVCTNRVDQRARLVEFRNAE